MVHVIFNIAIRQVRSWDLCVKRLTDMPWRYLQAPRSEKRWKILVCFFPRKRVNIFLLLDDLGEDKFSPLAPILCPV